jgi:prepilin-type N-terminal cleavage/methylation domain-containing protein
MMHILEKVRRRLAGDEGFTLVEAMVSITILAVGAFTDRPGDAVRSGEHRSVRSGSLLARRSISRWKRHVPSTTTTSFCRTRRTSPLDGPEQP